MTVDGAAELVIVCQAVVSLSVFVVLVNVIALAWTNKPSSPRKTTLAISWGSVLMLITFWRTAAWADLLWNVRGGPNLDRDLGITVMVWGIAAAACAVAAIRYYHGGKS